MKGMNCRRSLLFMALLALLLCGSSCRPRDRYVTLTGYAQGGTYSVKFNMNGRDGMIRCDIKEIKDSIDRILQGIDESLSGYNRNSLLSRFNNGEVIEPDALFLDIYAKAYDIYMLTGKAMYRLDADWVPVKKGDYVFMDAYCPQACYAVGDEGREEPVTYIYSKDCNRDVAL